MIYADSADKAARFVLDCNQSRVPLLFLQDVNGFDVGRDAERSGIIRRGAKLVNAVSNSVVPEDHAPGRPLLRRGALRPLRQGVRPAVPLRLARRALRRDGGAARPSRTMLDVNVATLKRQGRQVDDAEMQAMAAELRDRYDRETDIRYAAARGWIDAIIDPPGPARS